MSKSSVTNILAVLAVVVVIAGAAWFKSQRAQTPADDAQQAFYLTPVAPAGEPVATSAAPVAEGELCPEGVPATQPATQPVAEGAVTSAEAPADAKLPRLMDLGADQCKACKALAPILVALREEYKGRLDVEFIDVWKNPRAKTPYNIRLIPTQILYDAEGREVWRHEGFISKENLKALFAEKVGVK